MLNQRVLDDMHRFDTDESDNPTPIGTSIRVGRTRRLCVLFDTLEPGTHFWMEPRDNDDNHLTRSERPLSRCGSRFRGRPVWIQQP